MKNYFIKRINKFNPREYLFIIVPSRNELRHC